MKLQSLILISTFVVFSSCTREAPDMSRISLQVPESSAVMAKNGVFAKAPISQAASIMSSGSAMSKWALPAPANFTDINCFAVMISAPGVAAEASTCSDVDGNAIASPQYFQGGFLPGSIQTIEVPTGMARTIYLVGFHTASPSQCINLAGNTSAQRFLSAQFSPPVILSQRTVDLAGGDISVDMPVTAQLSSANRFEDCAPAYFSTDVAPSEPTAIISDFPSSTNLSSNDFTISGTYTFEYDSEVVFNGAGNCSDAVFDGNYVSGANALTVSFNNDGNYDLCVKARSASGKVQTTASRKSWVRDIQGPQAAPGLATMPTIGTDSTPEINVYYLPADSATIAFYSVPGCANEIYRTAISVAGPVTVTATEGNNYYSARVFDAAGNPGDCTSTAQAYFLDTIPPGAPAALSARYGVSLEYTPYFTWDLAADGVYGSGIAHYEVALGTSMATLEDLRGFTAIGNSFSAYTQVSDFFINGQTYYFTVRAVDAAGHIGASSTQAFTVDVNAKWQQQAFIKGTSSVADDEYGNAIAVDADTMVVGAASSDNSVVNAGAAMIYKRLGSTWSKTAYLNAPNRDPYDNFGFAVAVSGDTMVVGAPSEASNFTYVQNFPVTGSADNSKVGNGAAYVYRKGVNGIWTAEAYLKAPSAASGASFGYSVSIQGDVIVVGAPGTLSGMGKAHVYKRSGVSWSYITTLAHSSPLAGDRFGAAVSISLPNIAVGAPNRGYTGAAYFFIPDGMGTWGTQEYQTVQPVNGARTTGDEFGASLQLFGEMLVVGAPGEDSAWNSVSTDAKTFEGAENSGAAYVYWFNGAGFALESFLKPPNNGIGNKFGKSVGIFGTTVVVGAPGIDDCNSLPSFSDESPQTFSYDGGCVNSGGFYIYQGDTAGNWDWTNFFKPTFNSVGVAAEFGGAVAISGSTIVTGAIGESSELQDVAVNGPTADTTIGTSYLRSGAAYVFDVYDALPAAATELPAPITAGEETF